jgi:hypothetical protein
MITVVTSKGNAVQYARSTTSGDGQPNSVFSSRLAGRGVTPTAIAGFGGLEWVNFKSLRYRVTSEGPKANMRLL